MASRAILARLTGNPFRPQITQPIYVNTAVKRCLVTEKVPPVPEAVRNKQELYQIGDSLIHLKSGNLDGVMYRFTMGACVVSLGCIVTLFYKLARPKNN